jgi:hypothetical protein
MYENEYNRILESLRATLKEEVYGKFFTSDGSLNRIQLIKAHRSATGSGLRDAKHAIDALVPRGTTNPIFRVETATRIWNIRAETVADALSRALELHNARCSWGEACSPKVFSHLAKAFQLSVIE